MTYVQKLTIPETPFPILDDRIPMNRYVPIDLSMTNVELFDIDITDHHQCQVYIESVTRRSHGLVAYGGYIEQRALYGNATRFSDVDERNIHLGIDFWCAADTKVHVPLKGRVHSFANNNDFGNYGPTIILEHDGPKTFYTLYGHLSLESLNGLEVGALFEKGDVIGSLGTPEHNVGYAPHLHFQVINDLQDHFGDYPGVCSEGQLEFYRSNCPNPNLLLGYAL